MKGGAYSATMIECLLREAMMKGASVDELVAREIGVRVAVGE